MVGVQDIIHAEGVFGCRIAEEGARYHPRRRRAGLFFIIRAGGAIIRT